MTTYNAGGLIPSPSPLKFPALLRHECIVGPANPYTCIRPDHDDHPARLGQKLSPLPLTKELP